MKCNDCLSLMEQYVDGEALERDAEQVNAHLITCATCEREFELLATEQEVYARYDRELEIAFSSAMAVLIVAVAVGVTYLRNHRERTATPLIAGTENNNSSPSQISTSDIPSVLANGTTKPSLPPPTLQAKTLKFSQPARKKSVSGDQGGVLFTDAAYSDIAERDTASHLEQAQDLLVSFRNIKFSDDDEEVDVSYEKSESRRLLNENVVLRRDAEMAGKFPAKSVLGSLEPFLIDIANLPDKASPSDVRQIKDRVQKTEIVAELRSY